MSELQLLRDVYRAGLALRKTEPVDNDFPEMMHNFDSALRAATPITGKSKVIIDIENELQRARDKWPNNEHMLNALTEEVGELARALLHVNYEPEKHTADDVYREAIQTAVMAIRVATEGDSTLPAYKPEQL